MVTDILRTIAIYTTRIACVASPQQATAITNTEFGLRNASSGTVRATCNWWGDASGPTNEANPDGLGQIVSDNVIFSPWLTTEAPNDTCQSTIDSGVIYLPLLIR